MKSFSEEQQEMVDVFKERLAIVAREVISNFYTDVTRYAETDAHINFTEMLKEELRDSIVDEIATKYTHYSWAHDIRMKLLDKYKEQLSNKIIEDLQEKNKSLEAHIQAITSRRY